MVGIYNWADDEAGALAPPAAATVLELAGGTDMPDPTTVIHNAHPVTEVGPGGSASFGTCPECGWRGPVRFRRVVAGIDANVHRQETGTPLAEFGQDPVEAGPAKEAETAAFMADLAAAAESSDLAGMTPTEDDFSDLAGTDDTRPSMVEIQTLLTWCSKLDISLALDSTESALDILRAVRFAKPVLAAAEREAESFLADVLQRGTQEIPGYGPVTVAWSAQRTGWDRSALVARTAAVIADRLGYPVVYIRQAIDEFLGFTTPSSWKVNALKEVGLDVDEFCSTRWRATVVVEKDKG